MRTLVFIALLTLVGAASAAETGTKEEQAACRPDVRKFCGHIGSGEEQKYRDCLQTHFSELSQKCQQVLMALKISSKVQPIRNEIKLAPIVVEGLRSVRAGQIAWAPSM
jgi:hypothetical protein